MNDKLNWVVKHKNDFSNELDFLSTLLIDCGVQEEEISLFLKPTKKCLHSPFEMKNMEEALKVFHGVIHNGKRIFIKIDCDMDGWASGSEIIQFIKAINPNIEVIYKLSSDKRHGLFMDDLSEYTKDYFDLIIVPDASMTVSDAKMISNNFSSKVIVLDHHLLENEFFNKDNGQLLSREEAKKIYKLNKDNLIVDNYTNYCIAVNSTDGQYLNPALCGAGVVQKFIEGYLDLYEEEDELDEELRYKFYDLVSIGLIADSMDLRNLESRYYAIEGTHERYYINDFLNEIVNRNEDEMKWGRYITSLAWTIAPKINGCIRYGTEQEQEDAFKAILGVKEIREYQPRRKSKNDPKPDIEIHTLQWDMARVCENIKARQDTEVRKFVKELDEEIQKKGLDKNSILFVDGTKVLTKNTVTGLVANKLASKYFRPVVLMKSKDATTYGGSGRGYDKGNIENFNEFLTNVGIDCKGHAGAFGISFEKSKLDDIIKKCNELMPVSELATVHTVDWEIPANKLKREYVQEVAENYAVFGSTVPEPTFAISNLKINASEIKAYGENNGFIRFVYNGVTFVKKYCPHDDFEKLTLKDRSVLGVNKKDLCINIIGKFQLDKYEDKIYPQVRIEYFDSTDISGQKNTDNFSDFDEFEEEPLKNSKKKKKEVDNSDFDW